MYDGLFSNVSTMSRSALILLVTLLAGCAGSLHSEADCRSAAADWRARGYNDGYFGNPPQDMRLQYDCAAHGVQVAQADYLAGWKDGYDEFDRLMGSMRKMSR